MPLSRRKSLFLPPPPPPLLLLLLLLPSSPSPCESHNWIETPSRARSRASPRRPCPARKGSDLHAQIGKNQSHVVKFAAGHTKASFFAIVKGSDEAWLSHPNFLDMLKDYLNNAPPESANLAFDPKWKRYHAVDDGGCVTTQEAPACLSDYANLIDPATVQDSGIRINSRWCGLSDCTTHAIFSRRVPSDDPYFLDHPLEPTEWTVGASSKRGALFEYSDDALRTAGDLRVSYQSDEYPWLIEAIKFVHLAHMPQTVDTFRVGGLPDWAPEGHYVLNWWWSGYYDAVDFDWLPSVDEVEFPYGDAGECKTGTTKRQVCVDSTAGARPCCPNSRADQCTTNTNKCVVAPAIFNRIDHCQYVSPALFVTQAKVLEGGDDVQQCLDELQHDWLGATVQAPMDRAGVVVSPLSLPASVKVEDTLLENALRNATAMMKHTNEIARLDGEDEVSPVPWSSWFSGGAATKTEGRTCESYTYGSKRDGRGYYVGTLRQAILRCTGHECRGVVWVPRDGENTEPDRLYESNPDPPLQFLFCATDATVDDASGESRVAIMKEAVEVWRDQGNRLTGETTFKINFMKKDSTLALPSGWKADHGEQYGDRGDGTEYGWNYDVSDPHALSGVDKTCATAACRRTLSYYMYLQTSAYTSVGLESAQKPDRENEPSGRRINVLESGTFPESLDTTMFVFQFHKGERVPRRALDPTAIPTTTEYDVSRPALSWRAKVPNGVYDIQVMAGYDTFYQDRTSSRNFVGACSIEQSKIDYYPWQWPLLYGAQANKKFQTVADKQGEERYAHIRNLTVVVRDGYLDLSTDAVAVRADRQGIDETGGATRCHSISWLTYTRIAPWPPPSERSPGRRRFPAAWFPSTNAPWFQRDLGSTRPNVRLVRLVPPAAPRAGGGTSDTSEFEFFSQQNKDAPHAAYTGHGRVVGNDLPSDTCRSRFLFDGDSCPEDPDRGRELGSWDHAPSIYGYTVAVGDVPCDTASCAPDPNAKVCRPLPGLTEWSLGFADAGAGMLVDQPTPRPQTPDRPGEATWSALQLGSYLPWVRGGEGNLHQLLPLLHDCGDAPGRYVRVQLHGDARIFDAHVDVLGTEIHSPSSSSSSSSSSPSSPSSPSASAKLCYGVLAREARSLPTPLMEYRVSEDPNDPVFYSTCYIRERSREWIPQAFHNLKPVATDFVLETTCLSCKSWAASLLPQNETYVPEWTLDHQCTNCRSPSLAHLEHPALVSSSSSAGTDHAGNDAQTAAETEPKTVLIGLSIGVGLLALVGVGAVVVWRRRGKDARREHRGGSVQLKNMEAERNEAFHRYSNKRRTVGVVPPNGPASCEKRESVMAAKRESYDARSDWQQEIDPETETYYYFNGQTHESAWDPPASFRPCVWQIAFDDASGRSYFHNTGTGETSWTAAAQSSFPVMENNPMRASNL